MKNVIWTFQAWSLLHREKTPQSYLWSKTKRLLARAIYKPPKIVNCEGCSVHEKVSANFLNIFFVLDLWSRYKEALIKCGAKEFQGIDLLNFGEEYLLPLGKNPIQADEWLWRTSQTFYRDSCFGFVEAIVCW